MNPLILMPTSCQLPYRWGADQQGQAAMAQMLSVQGPMRAIAALSFPGLSVPTGLVGNTPTGVQLVAGSFREDILPCRRRGDRAPCRHAGVL
ncbi:hypothetical protein RA280_40795 [Cupriavidus sp. CV2]|uniref:hypothetical protein n=1 Tax=Cupriavidus ulmosensis TaxID=3065913 RepID=UPI00296B346D|nr:hypothetical protein [Cupriavidus sp. CV2]MDW3687963.1 hypothetical protein [Cupriavidus sp. CV2]